MMPHRFYRRERRGQAVRDPAIKTALLRMWLDSGYFALNQRMDVDMNKANEFTIADLLRNEPGVPVRGKGERGEADLGRRAWLRSAAGPGVRLHHGRGRTGIVRNAQGLNPDTLHDTAKGAMALMTAWRRSGFG
jgi:hypothetical protein